MGKKEKSVMLITAGVFVAEALVHYNIGANKDAQTFKLQFPKQRELIRIVGVVLIASYISTQLAKRYA